MINEIGIAFVAASPVLGFFIGDGISAKTYEKAFSEGERYGFVIANSVRNIEVNALRRKNQELSEELSRMRSQLIAEQAALIHARKSHPTAEAYMACMNWGARREGFSLVEITRRYERR